MKSPTLFTFCLVAASSILLLAPSVTAHGYLTKIDINGVSYPGPVAGSSDTSGAIRPVSTTDPVKNLMSNDMICGIGASGVRASKVLDVEPGSQISFWWGGQYNNWPHDTGPLLTYMASCGTTTCDQFDPSGSIWFKIAEEGQRNPGWYQGDLHQGLPYNATIPSTLAPGEYLIRSEVISLQLAVSVGGAELFQSCVQVRVGGSGTSSPSPNEMVAFPGAYQAEDHGIYVPNVYNGPFVYEFPGPVLVSFAAGGSGNSSGGGSPSSPPGSPSGTLSSTSSGYLPSMPSSNTISSISPPSFNTLPSGTFTSTTSSIPNPSSSTSQSLKPSATGSCGSGSKRHAARRQLSKRDNNVKEGPTRRHMARIHRNNIQKRSF